MTSQKEKTTPNVSVGADTEQCIQKYSNHSIADDGGKINNFSKGDF